MAKRTKDLHVRLLALPTTTKVQPAKADDVAPDDGVLQAPGASRGVKRRRKHAERAAEVEDLVLAGRLAVFEEAFEKVAQVAAKKNTSGYASEDNTRQSKSPDSELRNIIVAVQQGLQTAATKDPKKSGALANNICTLLKGDAVTLVKYTLATPGGPSDVSIRTVSSGRKSLRRASQARLLPRPLRTHAGICDMRDRVVAKKKKVADEANKKSSTETKAPTTAKKAEADEEGQHLTKLLDRALNDCVEDIGGMADATMAYSTALRPLALKLAKVYKPCAVQIKKHNSLRGSETPMAYDQGGRRMLWTGWCEYCTGWSTANILS